MSKRNSAVSVDVNLASAESGASFGYKGADEHSRIHVEPNGNIDLTKESGLNHGPVDMEFRLGTAEVTLDGILHDLELLGEESISITESGQRGRHSGDEPQFYGYANVDGSPHRLRFTNRNNDGKEYKYTLRIRARPRGTGRERWLEHDPIIQNRGGGMTLF